ncbi:MAG: hypothetical protein ACFNVK_12415, partial [Prevotella sp.]
MYQFWAYLQQDTVQFAAKRTAFRYKSQKKWVLVAVSLNKNSFCLHVQPPPFCTKTNPIQAGGNVISGAAHSTAEFG